MTYTPWILNPQAARDWIQAGATVWDARDEKDEELPGSHTVSWPMFSVISQDPESPQAGLLLADDAYLSTLLSYLGVRADRPLVVVGSPPGDGRLVWMLRTLGHAQAAFVDGGYLGPIPPIDPQRGSFQVRRDPSWWVSQDEVLSLLGSLAVDFLDVRTPEEFEGVVMYGESRRGHLPGALHLYYQDLVSTDQGCLWPRHVIDQQFKDLHLSPERPIIAYCTAGIRAAWVACVLQDLGYQVRNYAGSMREWSAQPAETHPLLWGGGSQG